MRALVMDSWAGGGGMCFLGMGGQAGFALGRGGGVSTRLGGSTRCMQHGGTGLAVVQVGGMRGQGVCGASDLLGGGHGG